MFLQFAYNISENSFCIKEHFSCGNETIKAGNVMEIYLDNSATTKCFDEVAQAVAQMMTEDYGNPSRR